MIITESPETMLKAVSGYFGRGITIFDAKGYYSDQSKKVVYVVVNRFEIAQLKAIVAATDPDAFVTVTESTDTMGANIKLRKKNKSVVPEEEIAVEEASAGNSAGNDENSL